MKKKLFSVRKVTEVEEVVVLMLGNSPTEQELLSSAGASASASASIRSKTDAPTEHQLVGPDYFLVAIG